MRISFPPPRSLWRDNAGTAVLELALALPMLMVLLLGMIDMSLLVASRIDAEQAAQRATDYALAIRPTSSSTTYIQTETAKVSDVSADNVTVNIFLECDGVRQSSFNNICTTGQDAARFVSVSVDRDVDFLFDWSAFSTIFGARAIGSDITVRGDSVVRFQ